MRIALRSTRPHHPLACRDFAPADDRRSIASTHLESLPGHRVLTPARRPAPAAAADGALDGRGGHYGLLLAGSAGFPGGVVREAERVVGVLDGRQRAVREARERRAREAGPQPPLGGGGRVGAPALPGRALSQRYRLAQRALSVLPQLLGGGMPLAKARALLAELAEEAGELLGTAAAPAPLSQQQPLEPAQEPLTAPAASQQGADGGNGKGTGAAGLVAADGTAPPHAPAAATAAPPRRPAPAEDPVPEVPFAASEPPPSSPAAPAQAQTPTREQAGATDTPSAGPGFCPDAAVVSSPSAPPPPGSPPPPTGAAEAAATPLPTEPLPKKARKEAQSSVARLLLPAAVVEAAAPQPMSPSGGASEFDDATAEI